VIFTTIIAFFQAIPAITGGVTAFTQAFYNAKVQITTARIGGDVTVAKSLVTGIVAEGQVRVSFLNEVAHSRFLQFLVGGFAIPWIIYGAKVIVWDNILCFAIFGIYGFTPAIKGDVATWAPIVLTGIFGTGSVMALGQMFYNRKER
jgi:hypothetical protein